MWKAATILGLVSIFVPATGDKHDLECRFWKQLGASLSADQPMPFGVKIRKECQAGCSNITCRGNIQMSGLFGSDKVDENFCFGVQLNSCEDPVRMQYYLLLPNVTQSGNITHNDTYEVPDFSGLLLPASSKLIIFVEMDKVNDSYVRFGLNAKVRILDSKNNERFPVQEDVVPDMLIDIPDCPKDKTNLNSFKAPAKCEAPSKPTTSPTKAPVIKSSTYGKDCEFGLGKCTNQFEMCRAKNVVSRNGYCDCIPSAYFSKKTGYCETKSNPPVPTPPTVISTSQGPSVTDKTSGGKSKGKGSQLIPIVVGSVAGVVGIGIIGILVIVFIGRRRRNSDRRQRQQLLSDDMMDEEDDPNVI